MMNLIIKKEVKQKRSVVSDEGYCSYMGSENKNMGTVAKNGWVEEKEWHKTKQNY